MKVETRLTDELIARYETSGHWGPETFYSVLAARAASHPDRVAIVDRGRRITYGELKTPGDRTAAVPPPGAGQGANDVMRMAFTSGTTGNPKGVIHSHNTTLSTCRTLNADMRVTPDEVFLIYLPLGLNWGYLTLVQAVMAGARAVLLDQFSARVALELIQRERVTYIPTAPASIIAMLNEPDLERFDLASLRVLITGGASCPIETIREFRARMHGHLIELYGMLETGFHTY